MGLEGLRGAGIGTEASSVRGSKGRDFCKVDDDFVSDMFASSLRGMSRSILFDCFGCWLLIPSSELLFGKMFRFQLDKEARSDIFVALSRTEPSLWRLRNEGEVLLPIVPFGTIAGFGSGVGEQLGKSEY